MRKYTINKNNTSSWKSDINQSVLFYNEWFLNFAPTTYINARKEAFDKIETIFGKTNFFNLISTDLLKNVPESISILRMATTPPLARERLAGLANVPNSFIKSLEEGRLPRMNDTEREKCLNRIIDIINRLLDIDIMPWLESKSFPHEMDRLLAKNVIGDRLCGSMSDPIIRNEQERRQLECISFFLQNRGYKFVESKHITDFRNMEHGTFTYHLNVPVEIGQAHPVNMPIDVVVMRQKAKANELPILIECKSAGDFTNTNKRRKEEATKVEQLKNTYGNTVEFVLFLCGYFDSGYLGYEAAEGIDWIWEHRIEDLLKTGI